MAYDQNDMRREERERERQRGNDRGRFSEGGGRSNDSGGRGFFERAGDEISSWFGDEEAERRRGQDDRSGGDGGREQPRGREEPRERHEQRDQDRGGWFGGQASHADREQDHRRPGNAAREQYGREQSGREQPAREQYGRDQHPRDEYRPLAGDYGRGGSSGQRGFSGRDDESRDRNRGIGAGSAIASAAGGSFGGRHADPHYDEWRQRQIDQIDRDYDDYRREHQSKFDNEFSGWRSQRQSKRQMMSQVREHMEVCGSDEQRIGTVDKIKGDRIILTKNDPEAGGVHRSLGCAMIDRIEGDRLILSQPAEQARRELQREPEGGMQDQQKSGERQDSEGPHNLERSFSGTYR